MGRYDLSWNGHQTDLVERQHVSASRVRSFAYRSVCLVGRLVEKNVMPLGTAFSLGGNRFATAAHVVGLSDINLVLCLESINSSETYQLDGERPVSTARAKIEHFDPVTDIAILNSPNLSYMSRPEVEGTDKLKIGDLVSSFGFPHADFSRVVITYQENPIGAKVLLESHNLLIKHLVLNTMARPGQSGAPVFDSNGRIRAMLVGGYSPNPSGISLGGVDPLTLHQTTHAVSSEYLQEFV